MMAAAWTPVPVRNASRPDDRVVDRDRARRSPRETTRAVLGQRRQVAVDPAQELQVDQQLVHRPCCRRARRCRARSRARGRRRPRRRRCELTTPRPRSCGRASRSSPSGRSSSTYGARQADQVRAPVGRGVAARCRRRRCGARRRGSPSANSCAQRLGVGARRVLGHVHDRRGLRATAKDDRVLGVLEHASRASSPRRTGGSASEPMKRADLDRDARLLRDLDDRADVRLERARRAVGPDVQALRSRSPAPGAGRARTTCGPGARAGRCRPSRCRAGR